jgi:hypothetical protein
MADVRLSRYRDGAVGWALSRDVSDPTHWVETFRYRDWHELQRGIERLNLADSEAVVRARSYHRGEEPPAHDPVVARAESVTLHATLGDKGQKGDALV